MNNKTYTTTIPANSNLESTRRSVPCDRNGFAGQDSEIAVEGYTAWSDAELLNAHVQQRCPEAFREIVLRYGPMVLSVCRRILPKNDWVEDAFQDTFVILANKGEQIREPDLLASWLYGVARRVCMEAHRKLRKETGRFVSVPSEIMSQYPERKASAGMADASIEVALRDAVDQLPDAYRAPIVLCYFMGETHASAAQALGVPAGSISTKLRVGQEKLRNKLKRMGFVVPIVAVTWLLSQMRVEAQVPEQLILSTLAKTASLSKSVGQTGTSSANLVNMCSKHLVIRYLVVALVLVASLATAEAYFVLPIFSSSKLVEIKEMDTPTPLVSETYSCCIDE